MTSVPLIVTLIMLPTRVFVAVPIVVSTEVILLTLVNSPLFDTTLKVEVKEFPTSPAA